MSTMGGADRCELCFLRGARVERGTPYFDMPVHSAHNIQMAHDETTDLLSKMPHSVDKLWQLV